MSNRTLTAADIAAARIFSEAVAKSGKSHDQLAAEIGVTSGMIHQWSKPLRAISAKRAAAAALAVGIDDPSTISAAYAALRVPPPVSPPETDSAYVRVEQIGEAGMGDARINDDYPDVIRSVDFTEPYIRSLVGFMPAPGRLKLVTGHGDSMVPTIMPGDVVLVDTGCNCFDGDGLYLVNSGNGQQIKMLQDRGSALFVVSANRDYPEFQASPELIIGGKVYLRNRLDRMA